VTFRVTKGTLGFKTKTETQDLQDQYWKSMNGMDCDKQKVMASRKSSIPVVAHNKQQVPRARVATDEERVLRGR